VATLVPATDLLKADGGGDSADCATAKQAIALIGRLITSEATSLANGQHSDARDIECLLDAVAALRYFCEREEQEVDTTGGEASMEKADTGNAPDLAKADGAATVDMAAIVKAAVAEATGPLRDELTLMKAQVAKVMAMPEPGGPAVTRTASQAAQARDAESKTAMAQAADLLAKAEAADRDKDPVLARGYRDRAALLKAAA
jgi:hypothetical protein